MKRFRLIIEGILIAFSSLKAHKLRTFLTMLGIAFGIFLISGISTLVDSLEASLTKNLSALGNTTLFVHNWPWKNTSEDWHKYWGRPRVSYSDYSALQQNLTHISGICFEAEINNPTVKYEGRSAEGSRVKGVTEEFGAINGLNLFEGRYFSNVEASSGRPVIILGINVAKALMNDGPYTDKIVKLSGKKVTVIGVLEEEGSGLFGDSRDDQMFVPYAYLSKVFRLSSRSINKLITVKADEYKNVPLVEGEIVGIVRANRGLRPAMEDDFTVNKQEMVMNLFNDFMANLSLAGVLMGFFSVVIAGFITGTIMYASVKERTFEIGLQKALGAERGFILFQFLVEAVLLCIAGGIVGLILIFGLAQVGNYLLSEMNVAMEIYLSGSAIIWGIIISVVIGLVSGIFPSFMASKLDPVESMRAN